MCIIKMECGLTIVLKIYSWYLEESIMVLFDVLIAIRRLLFLEIAVKRLAQEVLR